MIRFRRPRPQSPRNRGRALSKSPKRINPNEHHTWQFFGLYVSPIAIMLATIGAFFIAFFSFLITRGQLDAAKGQLVVMQQQLDMMQADQRPWLKIEKIDAQLKTNGMRLGGLRYGPDGGPAFMPFNLSIKNVGHTPAFDVKVRTDSIIGVWEEPEKLAIEQKKNCSSLDDAYPKKVMLTDNDQPVKVIFPGEEAVLSSAIFLPQDKLYPAPFTRARKMQFQLRFYGCIRYRFANSEPHQTGFAYRASRLVDAAIPGGKALESVLTVGADIAAGEIWLEPRPMTAAETN